MAYSRQFLRSLCDRSLFHFIKIVGGSVQQGGDISPHIHLPLCNLTQDNSIKRKAKLMPRIWRKSTCFTKWANTWRYLQNPEVRILIPAENENIGSRFLDFIERQILQNKMLRWLYEDMLAEVDTGWTKKHRWSGTQCELPRQGIYSEATFTVIGVGGAAQSGHYDFITPDDLIGKKAMESPIVMEGVLRWIDNMDELLVDPDVNSPTGSTIDLTGTHWAVGDYIYYMQQNYPSFLLYKVPALKDTSLKDTENVKWIQNPEVGNGESNFPEAFSTEHYIEMMNNPEKRLIFFSQQQNNPEQSEEFNKFDYSWIRWYHTEEREDGEYIVTDDEHPEEYKASHIRWYGMIDPGGFAEVRLMKGSNNAILIGGQPHDSIKKFVRYTFAGKMRSTSQFRDMIFDLHENYSPSHWRIEVFGQQGYIFKDIREEAQKRKKSLPISECPKDVGADAKDLRIQALMPVMENGEVYLHKSMKKLISEIISYPSGLQLDLLDCLGWLNQLYWSRKKRSDFSRVYKRNYHEYMESRSSSTGY